MFSFLTPFKYFQGPSFQPICGFEFYPLQIYQQMLPHQDRNFTIIPITKLSEFIQGDQKNVYAPASPREGSYAFKKTQNEGKSQVQIQSKYQFSIQNQQVKSSSISQCKLICGEKPTRPKYLGAQKKQKRIKKQKPQTKNLIKNYGRAILTFIIKNSKLRLKILRQLKIKDSQFLDIVYNFRQCIHTISGIRYIWESHPYSKAFRILSCQYLRKHNLHHIFNSRVHKFGVYLKYQSKLMKSMQRPNQFQSIKEK